MVQRQVVCAALRYESGYIVASPRHFDSFCHAQLKPLKDSESMLIRGIPEQGFIDQFGVFMGRYEALAVAKEANQLGRRPKCPPEDRLFSEDLY